MAKKPDGGPESPDPLAAHKTARALLQSEVANYRDRLVPELEDFLSKKTFVAREAEETTDLGALDKLSIRLRSLEIRINALSAKTEALEGWLQSRLALHIERDLRLAGYWGEKLLAQAFSELRAHFPPSFADEGLLQQLAPKTSRYLNGKISVPALSYAWSRPLGSLGFTQKALPPDLKIVDPLYQAPMREDIIKALLEAVDATLSCEETIFERLKDEKEVPSFAPPEPAGNETHVEWNTDLHRMPTPSERILEAQRELTVRNQGGMFAA